MLSTLDIQRLADIVDLASTKSTPDTPTRVLLPEIVIRSLDKWKKEMEQAEIKEFYAGKPVSKNAKLLKEFTEHCEKHPEWNFWHVLSWWTGTSIYQRWPDSGDMKYTFNFENKNS